MTLFSFRPFFLFFLFFFGTTSAFAQETPKILWVSNPVQPGETVMIYGGNWDSSVRVKLDSGKMLEPVSITDTNIMFTYPENHPGKTLSGTIICKGKESQAFSVNTPDIWWVHGDWGKEASPGGWIRVFGTAIAMEPDKTVLLLSLQGKNENPIQLKNNQADRWNIGALLPENLPSGVYDVILETNNVRLSVGTITIKPHKEVWKTDLFDVTNFGAVSNDGFDDTPAVSAALEKIKENDGGILYFPRGRFQITTGLEIPPRTLIRGESRELTQLYWPDSFDPPPALIKGTHSFGIEDITLFSGNHLDGIVSNRLHDEEHGNITIRRIRTRLMFTQYLYLSYDELARRAVRLHPKRVLRLGGDFVRILDCDLFASGSGIYEIHANNAQIANNRMCKGQAQGWNGYGGSRMIVENNHIIGPMCTSFYGQRTGSQNIYWGHNIHDQSDDANNREGITGDGFDLTYNDTVVSWEEKAAVLKNPQWTERGHNKSWVGGYIQLVDGKGAGQFRKIIKIEGNRVEFDRPWDIKPNEDTFALIAGFRRRFLFVDNVMNDSVIGLQFYGSMIETTVADNIFARNGGVHGAAMRGEPNWFFQFLDNSFLDGNTSRGPYSDTPAKDAHLSFWDRGVPGTRKYTQSRACVMRRNVLKGNTKIETYGNVDGVLIEDNSVKNADVGIRLPMPGKNLFVRNNQFENVLQPYSIDSDDVNIDPIDLLVSRLEGTRTLLKGKVPADWKEIDAQINRLKSSLLSIEAKQKVADKLLLQAAQSLSKSIGDQPVDLRLLVVLLGADVSIPNGTALTKFVQNESAASLPCMLKVPSSVALPLSIQIVLDTDSASRFSNWTFEKTVFDAKPGGNNGKNMTITKPAGSVGLLSLPFRMSVRGDDFQFYTKWNASDPYATFSVTPLLVAGPIEVPQGVTLESIYMLPKFKIDPKGRFQSKIGERSWIPISADLNEIQLRELLDCEKGDNAAYCLSAVRASRPIMVRMTFSQNVLPYVNGKPVGTTLFRGQWGCIQLNEGINTIVLVSLDDTKRTEWKITPVKFTLIEPLFPNDLVDLSVEELKSISW